MNYSSACSAIDPAKQVMAVVQPSQPDFDAEALTDELRAWSKASISPFKVPSRLGLDPSLPRLDIARLKKARISATCHETFPNG